MQINKVLITGITGFVGSHLADYILKNHPEVKIYGLTRWRSPLRNISHILNKVTLHNGDLTDLGSLLKVLSIVKPDVIFHLAAQSYVPYSFDAPIATLNTNVIGTCNLLEAVRQLKSKIDPIVHICSSSEVYGQVHPDETPITEDNPLRPASPYAVSKVAEDMLGLQYYLSYGIKTIRTRMNTHTGPRRGDVFVVSTFAKQIALIEAGLQEPIINTGNLESIRTFLDVRDAVHAYWLLIEKCSPGEVYNIGGNKTLTIDMMLQKLLKLSHKKGIGIRTEINRLRPSDITLQIPCSDRFKKITHWQPKIPFRKTLQDLLDYWRFEIWQK